MGSLPWIFSPWLRSLHVFYQIFLHLRCDHFCVALVESSYRLRDVEVRVRESDEYTAVHNEIIPILYVISKIE